jgi:hypothetical protein
VTRLLEADEANKVSFPVLPDRRDPACPSCHSRFYPLILPFAALFSRPTWQHMQVLLTGTLLCQGPRTVAAALRAMGVCTGSLALRNTPPLERAISLHFIHSRNHMQKILRRQSSVGRSQGRRPLVRGAQLFAASWIRRCRPSERTRMRSRFGRETVSME